MRRDFTYIDDIVAGVLAAVDRPPERHDEAPPHRVYNIGNNRSEPLLRFVDIIEQACGKTAIRELADMQPGDVKETRSEEHTSELQSLMRISYAVFCLKKNKTSANTTKTLNIIRLADTSYETNQQRSRH